MFEEPLRIRQPRQGEVLGIIEAMLGSNKLRVRCQDDKIRLCRIPGKLRKLVWMREGDAVLVKPWSIKGDDHGDILTRYTQTQVSWLRRKNILRMD
ncbi:MAG TPA: translation initiation factor eIF-1A [Candidatus Aenigmarchaeota archaeon]|nr:translation initiation factor eIF-1A [Candidatus Aenigmarchaeota archaeon]